MTPLCIAARAVLREALRMAIKQRAYDIVKEIRQEMLRFRKP